MGYRASLIRFPEQRTTVAVLSNAASINVGGGSVANLVLAESFEASPEVPAPFEPPATVRQSSRQLAPHAGTYWNASEGLLRTIEMRDGKLFYARGGGNDTELGATGSAAFVMLGPAERVDVSFKGGAAPETTEPATGDEEPVEPEPRTMTVAVEGQEPLLFEQVEPLSEEDLARIAGTYWSNELERELRLEVEDGQVLASWTDETQRTSATPIGRDLLLASRFIPVPWSPQDARLEVEYYDSGKVKGFTLNCEMVRGVAFVKQQ